MSNMIHVHVEQEDKFELIEATTNGENYNVLYIGEDVRAFMSTEQAEELFQAMDLKLNVESERSDYMKDRIDELENKIYDLEDALEEAKECDVHNNFDVDFDGESDFYQAK